MHVFSKDILFTLTSGFPYTHSERGLFAHWSSAQDNLSFLGDGCLGDVYFLFWLNSLGHSTSYLHNA